MEGRPTKFSREMVDKAKQYLKDWNLDEDGSISKDKMVPKVEGLSLRLGVSRNTIYEWLKEEDKGAYEGMDEFRDTYNRILALQGELLIDKGLSGGFNSTIAKLVMATNHGFKERTDTTTDDKPLQPSVVIVTDSEQVKEAVSAFEEALRPKR